MRRLLLVDDHDLFRQVLAVGLEQHTDLDESIQAMSVDEARQALSTHNDEVALAILAIGFSP